MEQLGQTHGQTSASGFKNISLDKHRPSNERSSKLAKPPVRISIQKRNSQEKGNRKSTKINMENINAFEQANWQLALKRTNKKMNRFYKGKEIGMDADLEHFKVYGPGIYLFFSFLKSLTYAFLAMSVVKLAPCLFNYFQGNGLSNLSLTVNYYFAKTTIGAYDSSLQSYNSQYKWYNTISDLICMVFFVIWYFVWLHSSNSLTDEVRNEVKLRSYTVVQMIDPPRKATQDSVRQFMTQFGKVTEVAAVKDYDETIDLSKKIYNLEVQTKQLQIRQQNDGHKDFEQTISKNKYQIDEIYKELVLYEDDIKEETIKYFITFATVEERQHCLKTIEPYLPTSCDCCQSATPDQFLFLGQKVNIKACHTEPGEIIWQNQHVTWKSRWIRALIQFTFLLAIVVIGFLFISFLNILAPSSTLSVDTSTYTSTSIKSETNSTIVQSWCITNKETAFTTSDSVLYSLCSDYIQKYFMKIGITIGISIAVIIMKTLMRKIVVSLAKFQRYNSHTDQSKDIIQNLFIMYVFTTVMITFALQAKVSDLSFKNLISNFIDSSYLRDNLSSLNQYNDFLSNWYLDVGYQIFITWVITAIHPTLTMPFVHFLLQKYKYWKAQGLQVQAKMQEQIEPLQFEIEDHYANLLMIVFVALAFSGGMPVIIIAAFFAIWFRYLYFKYIFLRFCKIPKVLDQALDEKVVGLLPYAVMIHFKMSIWMFGVSSIFSFDKSDITSWVNNLSIPFIKQIGFIIQRILGTWYYSAVFLLIFLIFAFKVILYNMIAKRFLEDAQQTSTILKKTSMDEEFNNMTSKALCDSYKIQNNPDYSHILAIMNKKRKFVIKVKDFQFAS